MKIYVSCADPVCGRSYGSREVASMADAQAIFGGTPCGAEGCGCELALSTTPPAAPAPVAPKKLADVVSARNAIAATAAAVQENSK